MTERRIKRFSVYFLLDCEDTNILQYKHERRISSRDLVIKSISPNCWEKSIWFVVWNSHVK